MWNISRIFLLILTQLAHHFSWSLVLVQPPPRGRVTPAVGRAAHHRISTTSTRLASSKGNDEPDLLDFFDPRLSPHAYPNGIDSGPVETQKENVKKQPIEQSSGSSGSRKLEMASSSKGDQPRSKERDLFAFFDPLLSPHAYPNGIDAGPVDTRKENNKVPIEQPSGSSSSKRFSLTTASTAQSFLELQVNVAAALSLEPSPKATQPDRPPVDISTTFDPTISPHAYTKGTPNAIVGDQDAVYLDESSSSETTRVVGILLVDHGSRNPASNHRLQDLARLYEQSLSSSTVVRAAHMEIATPTIADGIQELVQLGVDEIICHPYFLSPGRHVQDDIPRILAEAVETLKVEIPVSTTDPVGSNTNVMIDAIHMMVQQTASVTISRRGS